MLSRQRVVYLGPMAKPVVAAKTSVETSVTTPGRNGGTLRRGGGNPQRTGGRPTSELRSRMLGSLEERLHIAEEIADNAKASDRDRLAALEFLAKHSLAAMSSQTDPDGNERPGRLTPEEIQSRFKEFLRN